MKNMFFRNPGLKIASLASAFVVWFLIINVSNPLVTRTITGVPVTVSNASYIESQDRSYRIADGFDSVNVTVRGNRRSVERLSSSSFTVTADLTQIVDLNSVPVMVPLSVSVPPGSTLDSAEASPQNIQIVLEEIESADFLLNASTGTSSPAKGYEVGSLSASPERLTIRGPKSLIDRIDRVQADVDVSNIYRDVTLVPTLQIYDKNGDQLSESRTKYLSFSINPDLIEVNVNLYQVVTDIALRAETYGEPAPGYRVGEITVTPQNISLAGTPEAVEALRENGNKILIDEASHAVDITGASEDVEIQVNLPDYLSQGIRVAEGLGDTVLVSVKILKADTRSIEIQTKNIRRTGLSEGYNAVFADAVVDVRVQGSERALAGLSESDIQAEVDLSGVPEGEQTVPVKITLPDGLSLESEVETKMTISKTVVSPEAAGNAAETDSAVPQGGTEDTEGE